MVLLLTDRLERCCARQLVWVQPICVPVVLKVGHSMSRIPHGPHDHGR
jgi:hypothetical protein